MNSDTNCIALRCLDLTVSPNCSAFTSAPLPLVVLAVRLLDCPWESSPPFTLDAKSLHCNFRFTYHTDLILTDPMIDLIASSNYSMPSESSTAAALIDSTTNSTPETWLNHAQFALYMKLSSVSDLRLIGVANLALHWILQQPYGVTTTITFQCADPTIRLANTQSLEIARLRVLLKLQVTPSIAQQQRAKLALT